MDKQSKKHVLDHLQEFLSEHKKNLFKEKIANRTKHLTVVLENIYQPQNASAVLRTAEILGIQDVYIIENENEYNVNPDVTIGCSKWINLHYFNKKENNTLDCINHLKTKGYKIAATTPHTNDQLITEYEPKEKTALFFGTEKNGLSDIVINNADYFLKIPMYGFSESYNISVSAALCLFTLSEKLKNSKINWKLNDTELLDIELDWTRKSVKSADLLEKNYICNNI